MAVSGARAISRIAGNPLCQVQALMFLLGMREDLFYAQFVGRPFPGERGERTSALRWGNTFDAHLTANSAAVLLTALDGLLGTVATSATVRNLRSEVPGETYEAITERWHRTQHTLISHSSGHPVPDMLLQPPLRVSIDRHRHMFVTPDALVFARAVGVFGPLDLTLPAAPSPTAQTAPDKTTHVATVIQGPTLPPSHPGVNQGLRRGQEDRRVGENASNVLRTTGAEVAPLFWSVVHRRTYLGCTVCTIYVMHDSRIGSRS